MALDCVEKLARAKLVFAAIDRARRIMAPLFERALFFFSWLHVLSFTVTEPRAVATGLVFGTNFLDEAEGRSLPLAVL